MATGATISTSRYVITSYSIHYTKLYDVEEYIAAHDDVVARLVIDRFHVAQHYRQDFDDLRKQELKRLKKELPPESYEQDCKGTLWLLRKNHAALDDEERLRLRRLLAP